MTNKTDIEQLRQDKKMACFHADPCLYSPDSYDLNAKRGICEDTAANELETAAAPLETPCSTATGNDTSAVD